MREKDPHDVVLRRHHRVVAARAALLRHALEAHERGALSTAEREAAITAAQQLTGALGTYGSPRGSEVAAQLERRLLGESEGSCSAELDELDAEVARLAPADAEADALPRERLPAPVLHDPEPEAEPSEPAAELRAAADFPQPAPPKQTHGGRLIELEALRGIAAVLLVVYHAYQASRVDVAYVLEDTAWHGLFRNLEAGVALFLALSGFVIFLPFARASLERGEGISARGFLLRRAIRIIPLYYAAILIVWATRYFGGPDQWKELWQHLLFVQVFDRELIFYTIGPAWSLAVEVQFYIMIAALGPAIWWLCKRLEARAARIAVLLAVPLVLIAFSLWWKWWVAFVRDEPQDNYPLYFGPFAKVDEFALGMLVAVGLAVMGARRPRSTLPSALLALLALGLTALAFAIRFDSEAADVFFHSICGVAAAALIAAIVLAPGRWTVAKVLRDARLQWSGLVSYSVYLWHEPIMIELEERGVDLSTPAAFAGGALLLVVLSLLVGWVSWWLVERPAQDLRHLITRDGRWRDPGY